MNILKTYPWIEYIVSGTIVMLVLLVTHTMQYSPISLKILFIQLVLGWVILFVVSFLIWVLVNW